MDTLKDSTVFHFVPDGPESFLSIPGPLGVALRLIDFFPNSQLITSSKEFKKTILDSRIPVSKIAIYRKFQYRKRLATGFSFGFLFRFLRLSTESTLHLHYSRSISTALISLLSRARNQSINVVQTHGSVKFGTNALKKIFDYLFTRQIFKKADVIVALQENERNHLQSIGADKSKIIVIPNSTYPLSDFETERLSRKFSKHPNVLFVGHLRPSKQVLRFFEIASLSKFSHCNFLIAGPDGGDLKELKLNIQRAIRKNIQYLGSLEWDELSAVYCESDVILSPALDAPFDLSFLDGVSRGCIGVASKEFNNWSVLKSLGILIAEDTSVTSLEQELGRALDMMREGSVNRHKIHESIDSVFGPKVISKQWKDLYGEIRLH